jgi:SagB-type dehydrogenase family enzyme
VASAGALYPLKILLLAKRVEGIRPGLYDADFLNGQLTPWQLLKELPQDLLSMFHTNHVDYDNASCLYLICGSISRACAVYGERGYRFLLIETGSVAQNLALSASALELSGVPVGAFDDAAWLEFLSDVGGLADCVLLHCFIVGTQPEI